jgi:hypothetical protein
MAKTYLHIPAVGQLDSMACWAACLKWWYRAAKSIYKSQTKLIAKYNYLADDYGAMQPSEIEQIIVDNNMYIEVHDNAGGFYRRSRRTAAQLRAALRRINGIVVSQKARQRHPRDFGNRHRRPRHGDGTAGQRKFQSYLDGRASGKIFVGV